MTTSLRKAVDEYLALRRGLGFKLVNPGDFLEQFVSFLEQQGAPYITTAFALAWARQPANTDPSHWARRLSVVRCFAKHHRAADPRTEIPPDGLLPHRYRRKAPHIYADDDVAHLIAAAAGLPSKTGLRAQTYAALFGLLAVTGMRISEVIALDRHDVDLHDAVVTIRRTKFGKSRLVPLHPSTLTALRRYAQQRDRICATPASPSFLVGEHGERLTACAVRWTFVRLSREIGLRGPTDGHGPRVHDLRHRFAINTMLNWYRAGADVEQHLPELSTYLGHTHVTDTYWYLSAVPELLGLAAMRLERPAGRPS